MLQGVVALKELLPLQAAALLAERVALCYSVLHCVTVCCKAFGFQIELLADLP